MKKIISRFQSYLPVILVLGLLLIPEIGFAQGVNPTQGSDTLKGLAELSGVIIEILTFLALLMLNFFGDLLGTDMITGVEAMHAITPMWRWIRDLTNIMFVGVLLFLAFSNLFSSFGIGGEGGSWTIKEKLPKLIIAMIAINFSLLGFRVVIDAVNVGTVAIFGIADTRLEPDMSGLNTKLTTSRTWVKIDEPQKDLIISTSRGKDGVAKDPESNDSVVSGADCGGLWKGFIEKNKKECFADKQSNCALLATNTAGDFFACRGFRESINDLFCKKWVEYKGNLNSAAEADNECVFMIKDSFNTILTPSSEPGQNLFAAFGSVFMHLERLPALGAEINNLNDVVINTLFSVILAIAFIVALVAVFIAMVGRLIVLWVVLVFSPLLVGASILGIDGGKGGEISGKIVTNLIMPLKVAAAFAVGFVMMSAMVEWHGGGTESTFVFGAALSQLGQDEYSFLWQIATIVLFWMAAFWAVEGSVADTLIQGIKSGAEMLGTTVAKTLTIDRPMFTVGTGNQKAKFSLGSVLQAPQAIQRAHSVENTKMLATMSQAFHINQSDFAKSLSSAKVGSADDAVRFIFSAGSIREAWAHKKEIEEVLRSGKQVEMANALRDASSMKDFESELQTNKAKYSLDKDYYFATEGSYGKTYTKGSGKTPTEPVDEEEGDDTSLRSRQDKAELGVATKEKAIEKLNEHPESNESNGGGAMPVKDNGVNTVTMVDKKGQPINWDKFTTLESLNEETTNKGDGKVNFSEIYQNSNSLTKERMIIRLNETSSLNNIEWDAENDKFKEKP